MNGQYGVRIDQQLIVFVYDAAHLLLRTILMAQETGAFGNRASVNFGTCRSDTSRIPLNVQCETLCYQFAGFYLPQVTIALAYVVPRLQLAQEETHQGRQAQRVFPTLGHPLAGFQLHRSQAIFI